MGKVIMSGIVPPLEYTAPIKGILASDLAVGSVVKLMEGGVATEYLVVNQGKPSGSSLYDDSCDGLWLLRKYIKENGIWNSTNENDYAGSTIHNYLNSTFFSLLGNNEQDAINQVKIPYRPGSGTATTINRGAKGLSTKVFLLSSTEVGFTGILNNEGAVLSYFLGCSNTGSDDKRIAYLNATANPWWLRTPGKTGVEYAILVWSDGNYTNHFCSGSTSGPGGNTYPYGIRPALVLPPNALFDKETLILKGVK